MSESRKQTERRPVAIKRAANGDMEFHVTKRDGTVAIIPGPPGVTHLSAVPFATEDLATGQIAILFPPG